ncbi:prolyl oligopeptidase family serine peptidase [Actinophytocola sp.]|uniref:alpha/beta hydrolase family protein n=1 Tax=Actinophytocola sp. TaxID=1872138 RepID=UPI0025B8994D|nr:prolyl oligopeptidase family serine peptidase [Actinophytocola sp.]
MRCWRWTAGTSSAPARAYLRAYTYQRLALLYLPVTDSSYQSWWQQAVRCFRDGAALLDTPVDPVTIPFDGTVLPGYFLKSDDSPGRHRTLIMVGGGDTFVEDLYFYIGPAAVKRGYQVLIVDLPGQGELPFAGLPMRADAEAPMGAVVDYLLDRPDVDPDTLAAFGVSGGGYFVPRAATRDPRIKACVAASAIPDFREYTTQGDPRAERYARRLGSSLYQSILALMGRRLRARLILVETYQWRWGGGHRNRMAGDVAGVHVRPGTDQLPAAAAHRGVRVRHGPGQPGAAAPLPRPGA